MISKKKLKERLLDICAGAGMAWQEDEYFEHDESQGESVGRAIIAIEQRFDLGDKTRIRAPWQLKNYEHIDTMCDLVREALEHDV